MEFVEPTKTDFTIYSKSGCPNCTKVKKILQDNNCFFTEINCDDYILENKDDFLKFIENKANTSYRTFPMVFNNGIFVGGLTHTIELLRCKNTFLSFDNNF